MFTKHKPLSSRPVRQQVLARRPVDDEHEGQQDIIAQVGRHQRPTFADPVSRADFVPCRRRPGGRRLARRAESSRCERGSAGGAELNIRRDLRTAFVAEHATDDNTPAAS